MENTGMSTDPCRRGTYPGLGEACAEVRSSEMDIDVLEMYCGVLSGSTSVVKGRKQE